MARVLARALHYPKPEPAGLDGLHARWPDGVDPFPGRTTGGRVRPGNGHWGGVVR